MAESSSRQTAPSGSAGSSDWRKEATEFGPSISARLKEAEAVFPGRLHLYNIDNEQHYTIDTKQADSEVLLIEGGTVYYRVTHYLYAAPITEKGLGEARLVSKAAEIEDVHWAFIK